MGVALNGFVDARLPMCHCHDGKSWHDSSHWAMTSETCAFISSDISSRNSRDMARPTAAGGISARSNVNTTSRWAWNRFAKAMATARRRRVRKAVGGRKAVVTVLGYWPKLDTRTLTFRSSTPPPRRTPRTGLAPS